MRQFDRRKQAHLFPLHVQPQSPHFQRYSKYLSASIDREHRSFQLRRDQDRRGARLEKRSQAIIFLRRPFVVGVYSHGLFPLRLQPQRYKAANGFGAIKSRIVAYNPFINDLELRFAQNRFYAGPAAPAALSLLWF
jgi:hypothetical protein